MKKYTQMFLLILLGTLYPQTEPKQGFEKTRVDFNVPISPAFEILDEKPSSIVEPGSLREIAAILGATNTNPNSFGIEAAPFILFHKPSLPEYRRDASKRFLYRSRLSAAFVRNIQTQVSAGLRFTLLDETDLRLDENLNRLLADYARTYSGYLNDCLRDLNEDDPDLETKAAECADEKFTEDIRKVREEAKSKIWNKTIIETGIAVSGLSPDSLLKNLLLNRMALWFTSAFPLGESGQLFIGIKGLITRMDGTLNNNEASFAARGTLVNMI